MKKSNKEEFIEKAIKVHGLKYDYYLIDYINTMTKVEIYCNTCNQYFWQRPSDHLRKNGCPYCSIITKKILIGFNDLQTKNPQLASEWHPTKNGNLKPTDVTEHSGKKVWWICKLGHEWEAIINSRSNKNQSRDCPYCCSNPKVLKGFNDLETLRPETAKEWDYEKNYPLTPDQVTEYSTRKVHWICLINKNHKWRTTIGNRTNGSQCPHCSQKYNSKGENNTRIILQKMICSNCKNKCDNKFEHKSLQINNNKKFIVDCYCDKLKLCIEYHGEQHEKNRTTGIFKNKLEKQQLRDQLLREYCQTNNLKLIEIWNKDVSTDPEKIRIDLQNKLSDIIKN